MHSHEDASELELGLELSLERPRAAAERIARLPDRAERIAALARVPPAHRPLVQKHVELAYERAASKRRRLRRIRIPRYARPSLCPTCETLVYRVEGRVYGRGGIEHVHEGSGR